MRRGGYSVETAILVPIVALLGAGVFDVWFVVRARTVLADAMVVAARSYEAQDGPPDGVLPLAASRRFAEVDGRPARFRAEARGPRIRLVGSVRVTPPFGLIGQELHVAHTVWIDLAPEPETAQR